MDFHSEIEYKFTADGVDFKSFNEYLMGGKRKVHRIHAACPDVYYKRDKNVVRHRLSEGAGELTVKQRKSNLNIKDRLEIDLKFADHIKQEDVRAFLNATGWEEELTLLKDSYIYTVKRPETKIVSVLAYYTVRTNDKDAKSFIEIEIEKINKITKQEALDELNWWKKDLQFYVGLSNPLNKSLYEIYTGNKYVKVTD